VFSGNRHRIVRIGKPKKSDDRVLSVITEDAIVSEEAISREQLRFLIT